MPGATVVVTDESTNVAREALTDAQGLFEVPNLRPGTYTVDGERSAGSRKWSGRAWCCAPRPSRSPTSTLEVGGLEDVVTVTAEGQNNITLESQAIARGLDEQQLRDLPRNSRDIQDFLTLNPNVVGGFDCIQFLGGRTYGASYIQDGQPSSAGIFGELSNAAPGLDAIQEVQVLSNSYSAEYGGLAGVIVSTKRGANRFRGTGVLRLQLERAERAHLRAGAERRLARRSQRRHARPPVRLQHRRPDRRPTGRSSSATTRAAS